MKENQNLPTCEPASASRQAQTIPPRRILVVDDDADLRRLNTEVLTLSGYEVDGAEDGAAGWEALQDDSYDLVITDNSMPKVSGLELLKKLRAARMVLPIIMATGRPPETQFAQSPWLAPAATLLKPYTIEELLATVRNVLRAAGGDCEEIAPPPNRQSQPAAMGMRQ